MQHQAWGFLVFALTALLFPEGDECLRITDLMVPNVVENAKEKDIVLDCDYSFENADDTGLVVKWYLNDGETPVYQWIPPKMPQDFGKLKGKLNLGYKASPEPNMMYRALQIRTPSPELSGEYKCIVSTFTHEVSQSKKMTIFVPQRDFRLWHTMGTLEKEDNTVDQLNQQYVNIINVTCVAEGVFPEPTITISTNIPISKPVIRTKQKNGLYDVWATVQTQTEVTEGGDDHTFECELSIPETNYTVKKLLIVPPDASYGRSWHGSVWVVVVSCLYVFVTSHTL